MKFFNILFNNFTKSLNNSVVFTINNTVVDLPNSDYIGNSNKLSYLIFWITLSSIWIYIYKSGYLAMLIGFIIGYLLLSFKNILMNSQLSQIGPIRLPELVLSFLYSPQINKNKEIDNVNFQLINEWKILINSNQNLSDKYTYIWPAKNYLNYIENNNVEAINYKDWLKHDANKLFTNTTTNFNPDVQNIHLGKFYDYNNIITTIYYVMLTVITYGIYVSDAKLMSTNIKNKKLLPWILLVMILSLTTWVIGIFIPGLATINETQKTTNLKENISCLVISIAITTVLIV